MAHTTLLEMQAREKAGMPPDWEACEWKCMPPGEVQPIYFAVKGAIAPVITRGPRKGQRNWARKIKSTVRSVAITPVDHEKWVAEWVTRTGKCPKCLGEGQVFARWNEAEGTTYKPCAECGATGKAKQEVPA